MLVTVLSMSAILHSIIIPEASNIHSNICSIVLPVQAKQYHTSDDCPQESHLLKMFSLIPKLIILFEVLNCNAVVQCFIVVCLFVKNENLMVSWEGGGFLRHWS